MSLFFRSICSSSGGNCLALWSEQTRLLIDCGLSSMKRTRQALNLLFGEKANIDSVLLTHNHSDHISYYPLRVLEEYGHTIRIHDDCVSQLKDKHFNGYGFKNLNIQPFKNKKFSVGEFSIKPFEVNHNPYYPTYGFLINYQDKKVIIATDFNEWESVFDNFIDADFIFVESNHDLELLTQYYNPNSQFHLPNPQTGNLLLNAVENSKKSPSTIMLGHISDQRNKRGIARRETVSVFEQAGKQIDFELLTAPLKDCSELIQIG
ncbi:MAG: MBL fold metallo-hydrolase [Sedimentisphaerales bacterium]|nr:MBL fold metallo-hydrolase [Sedimentisphaerales bacterium]